MKYVLPKSDYCREIHVCEKATRLPNASLIGYGKWRALKGDFIVYKENHADDSYSTRVARVLGQCATTDIDSGKLVVLALSDNGSHAYIRIIEPKDVTECFEAKTGHLRFAEFFFSPDFQGLNPAQIGFLSGYGSLSSSYYTREHAESVLNRRRKNFVSAGMKADV